MTSKILEQMLKKFNNIKINAPKSIGGEIYQSGAAYCNVFDEMFGVPLSNKIQMLDSMKQDYCLFHNEIYNCVLSDYKLRSINEIYEINNFVKQKIIIIDHMSQPTQQYIKKICNLFINEDYNITHETDDDIISYYWILKFLPVYFEIVNGCYNVFDKNQRNVMANKINAYLEKYVSSNLYYKLIVDYNINFRVHVLLFKKLDKHEYILFFKYINELYLLIQTNKCEKKISDTIKCNNDDLKNIIDKPTIHKILKHGSSDDNAVCDKQQIIIDDTFTHKILKQNLYNITKNMKLTGCSKLTSDELRSQILKNLDGNTLIEKSKNLNICLNTTTKTDNLIESAIFFVLDCKYNDFVQIPKNVKALVWNTYVGKEKGIGKCYVCPAELDSKHFEAGHIISRKNGGNTSIKNLRPVCSLCNKSVGSINMDEFKKTYKL